MRVPGKPTHCGMCGADLSADDWYAEYEDADGVWWLCALCDVRTDGPESGPDGEGVKGG